MEERPACGVLACQAHVVAIRQDRRVGHRLRRAPVERQFIRVHARAVVDDPRHAWVQREAGRRLRQHLRECIKSGALDGRRDLLGGIRLDVVGSSPP